MKDNFKLDAILKTFCDPEHAKKFMHEPYTQHEFVYAADGHACAILDLARSPKAYLTFDAPLMSQYIPDYKGCETRVINVQEALQFINENASLKKETVKVLKPCHVCHGKLVQTCDLKHQHDCMECNCTGGVEADEFTGKKVIDTRSMFNDGTGVFNYRQFKRILQTAIDMGCDEITYQHGLEYQAYLVQIDFLKVAFMPCQYLGDMFDCSPTIPFVTL